MLAIHTPPLRDRKSDIPLLMQYFQYQAEQKIKSAGPRKVEDDAVDALLNYSWPGNVRQLRHVVEKLAVDTLGGSVINADAVRGALENHPHVGLCCADGCQPIAAYAESDSLDDFLGHAMLNLYDLLRAKTGSHSQTARQLRIDRTSLYQRLESVPVEGSVLRLSKRTWHMNPYTFSCLTGTTARSTWFDTHFH